MTTMRNKALLSLRNIEKGFDGVRAVRDLSCDLDKNEILGIIGPNGAGKTTLFNIISGFVKPDAGKIEYKKKNLVGLAPNKITCLGIFRTFQHLRMIEQLSALDNIMLSFQGQPGEKLRNVLFGRRKWRKVESANRKKAISLLETAELTECERLNVGSLSYGQMKLLSMLCCLATEAEVFLLDEPVAGISPQMIEKIITVIRGLPDRGKSVIMIEHNIDVIMRVCDRVLFMDAGRLVCEGPPEEVRRDPRVIEAYLD